MPSLTYDPVDTQVAPGALPRAQGASFTPAVGQALEQVGQQGGRLAGDLNRIEYMRTQYDEMSRAAKMAGDARIQFTKAFRDQTAAYNNTDGNGFVDRFQTQIDDFTNSGADQFTNPRAKAAFAEHMASIKSTFLDHSINWEYNQAQVYRETNIQDGFRDTVNAVSEDPTQFQGALDQSVKSIEGIPGELNPLALQTQHRLKNQITDQLVKAAGLKSAQIAPQATKNAILGVMPSAPDTITGKIVNAAQQAPPQAQKAGLTPNVALAVANAENDTYNPNLPNKAGSSAFGLFQMIDDTWTLMGGTKENRADPEAQAQLGVKNLADNTRTLSDSLRRPLSPGEIYSTQWGIGFAASLVKSPDNVPARDVFAKAGMSDPDKAAAMNGVATMNAGQLKAHFETMMRERMAKTAGDAFSSPEGGDPEKAPEMPWLKYASPELRQALLTHAEANLRHDDAGERASLSQDATDIKAAYVNGQLPQKDWDPSKSLRVFGAEAGAKLNNDMLNAQWYGAAKSQVATADPAQTQRIIADADAKLGATAPGSYGYANALAYSQSLHAAAVQVNNDRVKDQVGADQRTLQLTKRLDMSNPDFLGPPLAARFTQAHELQRTWGMKDYKPVSDDEAAELTDFLQKGQPSEIVKYLGTARVSAGENSSDYLALMQQIAPKAPLMAGAGAVAPYDKDAAQLILTGAGMVKDEKVTGTMVKPSLFQERWHNDGIDQAFGGWVENSRLNLQMVEAAYTAALPASKRDKTTIDDDTWNNLTKRITPVVDYNGPTLVPIGMNHDQFVHEVGARYNAALTKAGYDPNEYRMSTAVFLPNPRADGVYQVMSGLTPIHGAVIDLNTPPDTTFTPVSMDSRETPGEFLRKQAREHPTMGRSKY